MRERDRRSAAPDDRETGSVLPRRALGALGALGVLGLLAGRLGTANAANGQAIVLGSTANSGSRATSIATTGGTGLQVRGSAGTGIEGRVTGTGSTAAGVYGKSSSSGNYGVYSNGKLGVKGPVELTQLSITNFAAPASGRLHLYARVNGSKKIEVRLRASSTRDVLLAVQP